MKMPANVLAFSTENKLTTFHTAFMDYWNERRSREGVENLS